ncbi:alpha/beta hydrolase [Streptomyces sp. H34-S4]|uniref:alpha/beta hydrolase n=1 Tax=Streptomyces sp. H34-S4 TaxID=2996463 RepID=UPI002271CCCE|nr:alpha/beta hydrolase [Streptomyces sp. H34-S4]MCY0937464.1 alpha/beta hydrolase [Streptomyces sp. H34-S4]
MPPDPVPARARARTRTGARTLTRTPNRIAVGVIGAALVVGTLAATPGPDPAGGGAGIRWGKCPERPVPAGMRCGTLDVPLDYGPAAGTGTGTGTARGTGTATGTGIGTATTKATGPGKARLRIAVAMLPATGPAAKRLGSLVLNFGGPGAPGVATLAADPAAFAELNKRYALVVFDPRGVGHSEPVTCGGDPQETGETAASAPVGPAAQLAALRAAAKRCALDSGPVLPYIGTVNAARDLDLLRQALGEKKLDYLGFSYGTRLGSVYAALFPRRSGRMVFDGVDTLSEPLTEQALVSAAAQQRALDNFLVWCAHQDGCVYGTNTRTAKEKVQALVTRLDAEPLTGEGGLRFTGQDVVAAIETALYSKKTWPDLADALALVERNGDPVGLMQLGGPTEPPPPDAMDAVDGVGDTGAPVPADNSAAALVAVNCADDPDRGNDKASPADIARELAALQPLFLAASPVFGPHQLMTVLSCYGRPAGTDFIRRIDRPAGIPRILLVGTRGDPATPYEWTEETAKRLGNTVILDYKGDGHTAYLASRCVQGYVDHFLIDGRLPAGTRSCPAGE